MLTAVLASLSVDLNMQVKTETLSNFQYRKVTDLNMNSAVYSLGFRQEWNAQIFKTVNKFFYYHILSVILLSVTTGFS